ADLPGGTRQEAVTDADGTVTFTDVDWSKGTAAITAYREGSPLSARVGITGDQPHQRLWVRAIVPQMITVRGNIINYNPLSEYVVVKSPESAYRHQNVISLPYEYEVPRDTPFSLIAATFRDLQEIGNSREENSAYDGYVRKDFEASSVDI